MLCLGLVIGARGGAWPWTSHARANALDAGSAEKMYNELRKGTALQEGSELLAKIARLTTGSVVHIESEHRSAKRGTVEETGSGVLVEHSKARGVYVVTNRHVVDSTPLNNVSIHLHDGRVIHPAQVWSDKATDVAIMKVDAPNLQPARWGDSDKVEIGHMVLAMGSPFGLSQSITFGIISAKGRRALKLGEGSEVINQDFLQTDAAINPGNSGGPLIDLQGQVIGINTAIASNSGGNEGIGFSIPCNLVRNVIDQLVVHGKVTRAYLGVKLDPAFDAEAAARLKLDRVRGARVVEIYSNTPASRANLKFDDVVLTFDGIEVLDENHLINLVSMTPVNKKVKVVVFREGKYVTIEISVGDRVELEGRSEAPVQPGMGVRVDLLGLTLHQLDPDIAVQLGFEKSATGLLVLQIDTAASGAEELQLYDLIEEAARTRIGTIAELEAAVSNAPTDSILLKIQRRTNGRPQSRLVVLHR